MSFAEKFRIPAQLMELFAYGAATGIAFGIDFGLFALLLKKTGWHYVAAASVSFTAGAVVLYALSVTVVFRFRRVSNRALELSYFIIIGLFGLALNSLLIFLAVETLHVHPLVGKLMASAVTFAANYLLRRYLLFSPPTP